MLFFDRVEFIEEKYKKLPSHNIGFAKAGAKFPGVEDFRTLSRKKTFRFFYFL